MKNATATSKGKTLSTGSAVKANGKAGTVLLFRIDPDAIRALVSTGEKSNWYTFDQLETL